MDLVDSRKGIWKSAPGKGRKTPKGRQVVEPASQQVRELIGELPIRADLLIEFLHLIQDRFGHLSSEHLSALAEEMRLSQVEVYEVASFYAHFDVVKEGDEVTVKVIGFDRGKVKLSMKQADTEAKA